MALKTMLRTLRYTRKPLEFFQSEHPHNANYFFRVENILGVGVAKEKAGRDNAVAQREVIGLRWCHIASDKFRKE